MRFKEAFFLSKSQLKSLLAGRYIIQIGQYYRMKGDATLYRFAGVTKSGLQAMNYNIGKGAQKSFLSLYEKIKGKRLKQLTLF